MVISPTTVRFASAASIRAIFDFVAIGQHHSGDRDVGLPAPRSLQTRTQEYIWTNGGDPAVSISEVSSCPPEAMWIRGCHLRCAGSEQVCRTHRLTASITPLAFSCSAIKIVSAYYLGRGAILDTQSKHLPSGRGYRPLDSERAMAVIRILNGMAQKFETAIIVVTHDGKIIPTFRRIYYIRDGVTHEEAGEGYGFD